VKPSPGSSFATTPLISLHLCCERSKVLFFLKEWLSNCLAHFLQVFLCQHDVAGLYGNNETGLPLGSSFRRTLFSLAGCPSETSSPFDSFRFSRKLGHATFFFPRGCSSCRKDNHFSRPLPRLTAELSNTSLFFLLSLMTHQFGILVVSSRALIVYSSLSRT